MGGRRASAGAPRDTGPANDLACIEFAHPWQWHSAYFRQMLQNKMLIPFENTAWEK